jgi:hypothetical protein
LILSPAPQRLLFLIISIFLISKEKAEEFLSPLRTRLIFSPFSLRNNGFPYEKSDDNACKVDRFNRAKEAYAVYKDSVNNAGFFNDEI